MQEKVQSWLNKLLEKWNNLESAQKFRLVGAAVAVAVALGVAVWFLMKPNMELVSTYMDPVTAEQAGALLTAEGIRSQRDSDGKFYIEAGKTSQGARIITSQDIKGLEPFTFADALANNGMTMTQTMQKASLNAAKEAWVGSVLKTYNNVEQAYVSLYVPDSSTFFLQPSQEAQASVQLVTNAEISKSNGESMARFIQTAVSGLKRENITITDQNYNIIFNGEAAAQGGSSQQADFELIYVRSKEDSVKKAVNGRYGRVEIMSTFSFNWDVIAEEATTYTSPDEEAATGVPIKEIRENQSGTNTSTAQEPGIANNANQTPNYQTDNGSNSSVKITNSEVDYLYNILKRQTTYNTGNWLKEGSSMGIIAYNSRIYDEAAMTKNDMLNGMTWAQFKASVPEFTKLDTDEDLVDLIKTGTGIDNIKFLAYEIPVFVDAVVEPLDIKLIVILSLIGVFILLLAYGLIKRTQPDEIEEIEPELSVEDLLVSTQIEEQKEAEIEKLKNIELGGDSEVKKQIMKFVADKPEAVAGLLRNWLNDEWD